MDTNLKKDGTSMTISSEGYEPVTLGADLPDLDKDHPFYDTKKGREKKEQVEAT